MTAIRYALDGLGLVIILLLLAQMPKLGMRHKPAHSGSAGCATCHAAEAQAWANSHHALATVTDADRFLGRFDALPARDRGISIIWRRAAGGITATLDGQTVPVHAALGRYPLQQYLADMPGGRLQVLPLAWDARPAPLGGQRWFDPARPDAPPWTSRDQTWNFMCVDCHSTEVKRNYDLATDSYRTETAEQDVGCEACHGPGAAHTAWARAGANPATGPALSVRLAPAAGEWGPYDPATGIRHWAGPARSGAELDVCAPCHARRRKLVDQPDVGAPFLDNYEPRLLDPALYQADGQIMDENFEYGSFLQSRMFRNGVICSDCHDPHTGKTRFAGNDLCGQCHNPARFDSASHYHHAPESAASRCVACHMPTRTYMGVHARHDHAIRIPRPDIGVWASTSDACTACHTAHTADWAAAAIRAWRGDAPPQPFGAPEALATARRDPGRAAEFAADPLLSPIVRATLLTEARTGALAAATDPNPLVRLAAASALPQDDVAALTGLASDPVRAVRVAAARRISSAPSVAPALAEWRAAENASADRPESHLNLGSLAVDQGQPDAAAAEFHTSLRLEPDFAPAMIDLADLSRARGDEANAEHLLRAAAAADPANPQAWYALTLSLIRQHRLHDAAEALRHARKLRPQDEQYEQVQRLLGESAVASER